MRKFVRGQRAKIEALTTGPVWLVSASVGSQERIVFDISCFGVDENDILSDNRYPVFYNQRRSPEGEIEALGPNATGSEPASNVRLWG
jgi:tellurite resistance protein TerA